jgi:phage repressor protein C with HTH and peptisase S24 domain
MKASGSEISARLKVARTSLALNQKEFASQSGASFSAYQKYEMGMSVPGGEAIEGFVRLGINANWLLTGEGPMRMADITQSGVATADRVYAPIPRFTVEGKEGQEVDISSEVSSLAFDRQWYEQLGLRPVDAVYARMPDNTMEPTIREGGIVVIDASTNKLRGDGVYCLMSNGTMAIKRLQADFGGGLWVRGDNSTYKEQHVDQDKIDRLYIIGKVIWAGGQL